MAKEINLNNFDAEVINYAGTVVADFWAPWCGPCRSQAPILEDFEKKNPSIKAVKVNVDDNEELSAKFGVFSIPTIIVFKNGQQYKKAVGVQSTTALAELTK